jgi:hypothetical protein
VAHSGARSRFTVKQSEWPVQAADVQGFLYNAGVALCNESRFTEAELAFNLVLAVPCTQLPSAIAVASAKRLVLLAALLRGQAFSVPQFLQSDVRTELNVQCRDVTSIVKHAVDCQYRSFFSAVAAQQHLLQAEGLLGLALACSNATAGLILQKVAKTYTSVHVERICALGDMQREDLMHALKSLVSGRLARGMQLTHDAPHRAPRSVLAQF